MSEIQSRLAIAASLLWLLLASFVILGTHTDAVAQLGVDEVGLGLPAIEVMAAPEAIGQC